MSYEHLHISHTHTNKLCRLDPKQRIEARVTELIFIIPALGKQRQVDLSEFKANLGYIREFQVSQGSK